MENWKTRGMIWLVAIFWGLSGVTPAARAADNAAALGAGRTMKAIYDVNVGKAEKLSLYLRVIAQTVTDVEGQGLRPDFVVALRGSAVRLVSSDKGLFDEAEHEKLGLVATQVAELQKRGVRFEACSIATDLFGVDNGSLLPGVQAVGNTFVSLVGYQTQGYALVPIL